MYVHWSKLAYPISRDVVDGIVRPNPRIEVVTVSKVIEKIRHQRYDSRKYELTKRKHRKVMSNSEAQNLEDK